MARRVRRLDVDAERDLLAVVEVGGVVREEESDVEEVVALLDGLDVLLLEERDLVVEGLQHLLDLRERDVFDLVADQLLVAGGVVNRRSGLGTELAYAF